MSRGLHLLRELDVSGRTHGTLVLVVTVISLFLAFAFNAPLAANAPEAGFRASVNYTTHDPIMITGDAQFTADNGVTGGTGILGDPYIIENWEIDATQSIMGFGIMISGTDSYFKIQNVHIYGLESWGIALSEANNGTVTSSVIENVGFGIFAMYANSLNVTNSVIANASMIAMEIAYSEWVLVTGNDLTDNEMTDIALSGAVRSAVMGNTCLRSNLSSILVIESDDVTVADNNVSDSSGVGIGIENSVNSIIRFNDITMNEMGFAVNGSANLEIYNNRFIGNTVQAMAENVTNVAWDAGYPTGGNYWSNYSGEDVFSGPDQDQPGSDGIGDTPFIINGTGVDRYPWMTEGMVIPEFGVYLIPVVGILTLIVPAVVAKRRR